MSWTIPLLFAAVISGWTSPTQDQSPITSLYSDLGSSKCKTTQVDKETGSSVQNCPGIAGYKLQVLDDDSRQSITVVTPDRKEYPLDLWDVVTRSFSSVGNKAEWRVATSRNKISPVALIVRVQASEESGNPRRVTSYLAVAKITPDAICVTHKIPPGAKANEEARRVADGSQSAPCLKDAASNLP
jgi:hypothetical protein